MSDQSAAMADTDNRYADSRKWGGGRWQWQIINWRYARYTQDINRPYAMRYAIRHTPHDELLGVGTMSRI
jgi:hypothetical protein